MIIEYAQGHGERRSQLSFAVFGVYTMMYLFYFLLSLCMICARVALPRPYWLAWNLLDSMEKADYSFLCTMNIRNRKEHTLVLTLK